MTTLIREKDRKEVAVHCYYHKVLAGSYGWILGGGGARIVGKIGKEVGDGEYINHVEEMTEADRGRRKSENEGFNNQKNGIYDIEHLNIRDSNEMKNHYLITQMADIMMQLYLAWSSLKKEI